MFERFLKDKRSIFLYSLLLFSIGSFGITFFPPDEPKYVDAALRMIETGNYVVPFFNCHIRFDKPILYYWELVLFFKVFFVDGLIKAGIDPLGIVEYAARLPSIITASFTAVYIYKLADELFDKEAAKRSVVGFVSTLFFFYLSRAVYPDMSLILFELMGVYYFIKNRYCLGWFFTALAFLVKGPIGIVSVGFTYFLYLWIVERKSGLKEFFSLKNGAGFLLFLFVSLPWYIAVYKMYGMEFVNKFFIYHNIERFTGRADQHPHSFFYFFPIAIAVLYLWLPYFIEFFRSIDFKDRKTQFLIAWFLWVFLFFSISRNKLAHYIAFGFLPLSIMFGAYASKFKNNRIKAAVVFLIEFILGAVLSFYVYKMGIYYAIPTLFFGMFFVGLLNFYKDPVKSIFYKTIALTIVAFVFLVQFEPYRATPKVWREVVKTHLPLVEYRVFNQSLVAYTRLCQKEYRSVNALPKSKDYLLYTKDKYLGDLKGFDYKILYSNMIDKDRRTALLLIHGQ
ncbi:ArnT family glycosyltransferase [Hippea alviniae]|uniref:ArnT family glycosyltransferase n=1 Tax=Hippea alviniae TaxID=1279027 RepID=UPI0003B3E391|nr:glycosyltransferase family 39 protein [Hippea alviniae]